MLSNIPSSLSLLGALLPYLPPTLSHAAPWHPSSYTNVKSQNNTICKPVSFTLTASAQHISLSSPPDPTNSTAILETLNQAWDGTIVTNGTQTVSGTYTLKAIYCQPSSHSKPHKKGKKDKDDDVLQILLHGATYNKTLWSGYGFDYPYDWQSFAASQGYHTLAVDRLSHGDNDAQNLDPLNEVQMPLQTELLHQLISLVKSPPKPKPNTNVTNPTTISLTPSKSNNPLHRTFPKIILVGHSLGSYLSVSLARSYPLDPTALILTGYSHQLNIPHVRSAPYFPAPLVFPTRFPSERYKNGLEYLTIATLEGRTNGFYSNETDAAGRVYDPAVARTDYEYSDATTLGEVVSLGNWGEGAGEFEGPVLVATGRKDWICCSPPEEACVERLWETGRTFPKARRYEVWAPEETGHDLTLEFISARETLRVVHEFLGREV
ncbi:Alpha/Beta hydrolase protein [Sordaria brevicollis]|uniref:Alpha/Beta hydrolase protein n=1 Tax=Sordaria brevicollis TaxID=83679 RepID=A0AAE0PCW5_SORBR|nr:Alpha/Beta hydrolase protein [Sordaria brevicollis]